jgi:ABC-2 type transport system permease protein
MKGLFLPQLGNELVKLFARKRSHMGFVFFLLAEFMILFLLNLRGPKAQFRRMIQQNGFGFEQYFSGLTLGLQMVLWTTFILGGLYLALVAGDVVAKEVEEGTMRMTLCRPVSRLRVIGLKYLACLIYTLVFTVFIGLSALAAGTITHGWGGLFVLAPIQQIIALYPAGAGLARYLGALPLLALCLASVTSLGFLFSCCNMKPAAATIITLSIFFFDSVFRSIPYFESFKPYFITTHMATWLNVFINYIPWWKMTEDYAYLLAIDATFFVLAVAIFTQRDFKA